MKKLCMSVFLLCTICLLHSQQGGPLTPIFNGQNSASLPLTPEAYSLLKFDINPVDLNTGIPDISENLYSVGLDKNISINLNIKYHPSGIRIKEMSGLVGQGWNLTNFGVISREVNGLPDDKPMYGILDNGFENALSQYGLSHDQTIKYMYNSKFGTEDIEYDLFHFSFLNHSGSFKLNKNGTGVYIGRGGNYKIFYERNQNDASRISKITIIDDLGYKYLFDKKVIDGRTVTKVLNYENMHSCMPYTPMESTLLPPPYVTWYLSEIQTPENVTLCQFSYDASTEVPPPTKSEEVNLRLDDMNIRDLGSGGQTLEDNANTAENCTPQFCNHRSLLPMYSSTTIQNTAGLALTKISMINKGTIDFNVVSGKIESISIKTFSGSIIKKIDFNYLTTYSGRRFLKDLYIKNKDNVQAYKYSFEYDSPEMLPSVLTNNYDYWGYFNNKTNTELIIDGKNISSENKWTDKDFVTSGVLKKMILPTGGYKEFLFESNRYTKELSNPNLIYDVAENRTPASSHFTQTIFNGISTPDGSSYIYIKDAQRIILNFSASQNQSTSDIAAKSLTVTPIIFTPSNPSHPNWILQSEIDNAPEENSSNTIQPRSKQYVTLDNVNSKQISFYGKGYYRISITGHGDIQFNPVQYHVDTYYYTLQDNIQYLYGGGLRIKEIKISDGNDLYSKNYDYTDPTDVKKSSGEIINTPVFTNVHAYNWSKVYGSNFIGFSISPQTTQYLSVNELGYSSVNAIKGSYVNYKFVKISDNKGKIENTFSVYSDYPDINYDDIFYPAYKFHHQDYKIGLLMNSKIISLNNVLLRNTDNQYEIRDFTTSLNYKIYNNSGGCYLQNGPWSSRVGSYDSYMNNLNAQPYPSSECGTNPLSSSLLLNSFEKYGFSGIKENKETEYFGIHSLEKTIKTTYNPRDYISKRDEILADDSVNEVTYSYAHEKSNIKLINANIIGIPLESSVLKKANLLDNGKIVSKSENKYDDPSHHFPSSVLSLDLQSQNASNVEGTYDRYDPKGNLLQYTTKDGIPVSIIWGYNDMQPIAKIAGAKWSDIAPSLINTIVNESNTDAQFETSATDQSLMNVLDAFRKDATISSYQITTYTYDQMIGVTTVTPPSGIREIYIYDSFNRLKEIRENNSTGKIIKEFKYNYKQ